MADSILDKMRKEWDARAKENARYYVNTERADWTDEDFFKSGERTVAEEILTDMGNICQGKEPGQMRVLEIGCGAGRVTRALSGLFGEVHAVDVSGEMIAQATAALADRPNAHVYQNNGTDLSCVPDLPFDFAFSTIVFQHIPSREVIETYVREVSRLLTPGRLFKFQVQGYTGMHPADDDTGSVKQLATLAFKKYTGMQPANDDTWLGVSYTDAQAVAMAERCGFEPRHRHGAGEQYFWLWFFKR